jgi:hypothetical protein
VFRSRLQLTDDIKEKSKKYSHPICTEPIDQFYLPVMKTRTPLSFAHCQPSHSSLDTLLPSGSLFGLAPGESLSQITTKPLMLQLLERETIHRSIWSVMLINGQEGVFSISGTMAGTVESVNLETQAQLDSARHRQEDGLGELDQTELIEKRFVQADDADWWKDWRWTKTQGAEGWWQILIQGVLVGGSKVLRNQPAILDVCLSLSFVGESFGLQTKLTNIWT